MAKELVSSVSDEQLAAAKALHPEAVRVTVLGSIQVVVRPPTRVEWRIFRQAANSPSIDKQVSADEQLFALCCAAPDKAAVQALIDRWPALPSSVAPVISKLAGFDAKAEADF